MLSRLSQYHFYADRIWVGEGRPTCVKLFVSHDLLAATFNSVEFAEKANDLDGTVSVCVIQSRKVGKAGHLLGSRKTMGDTHWCTHYSHNPRLLNIDVQIKSHNIKNITIDHGI